MRRANRFAVAALFNFGFLIKLVAVAAIDYLEENPKGFDGTVKGLLDALTIFQPTGESWPRSAKGFADILRRLAPAFRTIGINAKINEKAGKNG